MPPLHRPGASSCHQQNALWNPFEVFFKKGREADESGVVLDIGCGHASGSRLFAPLARASELAE